MSDFIIIKVLVVVYRVVKFVVSAILESSEIEVSPEE